MACQWVESIIAESACGIMDQIAVTLGEQGCLLPFVCQHCLPQPLVRLPDELALWGVACGRILATAARSRRPRAWLRSWATN